MLIYLHALHYIVRYGLKVHCRFKDLADSIEKGDGLVQTIMISLTKDLFSIKRVIGCFLIYISNASNY